MLRTFLVFLIVLLIAPSLTAQPRKGVNPLDDRGGLMIPEDAEDLRVVSLELWLKFQRTNQNLYNYIREAAEFRAYVNVCKRHDLNVNMRPINTLSGKNLQQIILAHYEEPEYAVIEALDKPAQASLMEDIAGDIYAFEYGHRIAEQRAAIAASGQTNQSFCSKIADEYFKKYVALLATARNALGTNSN